MKLLGVIVRLVIVSLIVVAVVVYVAQLGGLSIVLEAVSRLAVELVQNIRVYVRSLLG